MRWLPWTADAFARATRERKPVLLSLTAPWCRACHEMDRTTYADPRVQRVIDDRFVAVRVDADERPDINERYNLGGWPTTAFLTPEGDVLGGGTFVPAERMIGVLEQVASAFANLRPDAPAPAPPRAPESPPAEPSIDAVFASFDELHGGFGVEPKFPITAPLHLALALARIHGDRRWLPVVERTLDAIAAGGLHDAVRGGYYRYATTRDWQLPHDEKLLDTNAALLRAFADAYEVLGRADDRTHLVELARFIRQDMRLPSGAFAASAGEPVWYLDSNAAAAGALLRTAAVLDDPAMAREALAALEAVLLRCYRPGAGVAHGEGAAIRGLLTDQVAAIAALLDAHEATGDEPYCMMATELAHVAVRTLGAEGGGFQDRAPAGDDAGLLRTPRTPFVANCEAARALRRLARAARVADFLDVAAGALTAARRSLDGQGPLAAHYLLAVLEPESRMID